MATVKIQALQNLEYVTHSENMIHSYRVTKLSDPSKKDFSRMPKGDNHASRRRPEIVLRGERAGKSKLKDADVLSIRSRYAAGESNCVELATEYGVYHSCILAVIHRRSWTHI